MAARADTRMTDIRRCNIVDLVTCNGVARAGSIAKLDQRFPHAEQ
jgi:hypothetical protein